MVELDGVFVRAWSDQYRRFERPIERRLLEEVEPAMRASGWCTREQLLDIGRWKSPRTLGYLRRNSDDDVTELTGAASAAPFRWRHRALTLLHGVGVPFASAILTVWAPEEYTVTDVYAREAMERLVHHSVDSSYVEYVRVCQSQARRLGVDLRTLDRALWQWGYEGYPDTLPDRARGPGPRAMGRLPPRWATRARAAR